MRDALLRELLKHISSNVTFNSLSLWCFAVQTLWLARNRVVFEGEYLIATELLHTKL
jgi:hypothetical protein